MQLVWIERTVAANDDQRLTYLLEARAKAAAQCVAANAAAHDIRADLLEHLARRLQEGADAKVLRKALQDSGVNPTLVTDIMREASGPAAGASRSEESAIAF